MFREQLFSEASWALEGQEQKRQIEKQLEMNLTKKALRYPHQIHGKRSCIMMPAKL